MKLEEAISRLSCWDAVDGEDIIDLRGALGRVLAEKVVSPISLPPFDNSAMDGFAFCFADLPTDRRLEVVARIVAGSASMERLPAGKAARIFTGAALPDGADTIAMQEHCTFDGRFVMLPDGLQAGANRRIAGEDVGAAEVVLRAGTRLRAQHIGMAAAVGRSMLRVRRRVRVGVFATGDELRRPGTKLTPGAIYDSNRHAVLAALDDLGAVGTDLGLVPDDADEIEAALVLAARDQDLVISSGGVSVGDEDHVKAAVERIGRLDFWKLALKPGKPVAVGNLGRVAFVGLPGNPVSAMIIFWLIARPLLLRRQGVEDTPLRKFKVVSGFHKRHLPGRREFLRVQLHGEEGGLPVAKRFPAQGSGVLSSLVWAEGLAEVHETWGDVVPGDILEFIPYDALRS